MYKKCHVSAVSSKYILEYLKLFIGVLYGSTGWSLTLWDSMTFWKLYSFEKSWTFKTNNNYLKSIISNHQDLYFVVILYIAQYSDNIFLCNIDKNLIL